MSFFRHFADCNPDDPALELRDPSRLHIWTRGWHGAAVLFVLIGLGLGCWKGADVYDWIKKLRVDWLISQSEKARARGDFQEVKNRLMQAMVLRRRHPSTLRAVARYQIEMHDLSAFNTYAELLLTGQATTDDKVTFSREAFRLGRWELAAGVFDELKQDLDTRERATVLAIEAGQAAAEGRWPKAFQLARQACASRDDDQGLAYAQLMLGRLLLQSRSSDQAEGVALLCSLALRPDAVGLEALEILVAMAQNAQTAPLFRGREASIRSLIDAAERHSKAAPVLRVAAWSLQLAAEPARRSEIMQALFQRYRNDPSLTLRMEAARWLNQMTMHGLALDLARPLKLESEQWFLLYLDATAALGDWEAVFRTLSKGDQKLPLSAALLALFQLRAAMETGRLVDLTAAWRDINIASRTDTAKNQLYLAGYAEQIGFPDEAARLYQRLVDRKDRSDEMLPAADVLNRQGRLACYTGLLRTSGAAMTLDHLRAHMSAFAEEFPEIDDAKNDWAYVTLLAGRDLHKARDTAQRLLQKKPELLAYRTTVALAALRQREAVDLHPGGGRILRRMGSSLQDAAALYDGWAIDWSTAEHRYRAVYVAALRAAGRTREAVQVADQIKPDALRPEERTLAGIPRELIGKAFGRRGPE